MVLFALLIDSSGWMEWAETYLNYPGLEAWKFINLTLFVVAGIFIVGKKLTAALAARREGIQQLLAKADSEREAAQLRLTEAETLVAHIDDDVAAIHDRAKVEVRMERERLAEATEKEIEKMRSQAQREIERAGKVARLELQRFLANRSIELARDSVRSQIKPEDDSRLIDENIGHLRRAQA